MVKSISYNQDEIIQNIIELHTGDIDLDPTYSIGNFYKSGKVKQPKIKSDLIPTADDIIEANANNLPLDDCSVGTIMFDPPFVAGHTKDNPTGIIGKRFHGFRYVPDLWKWYDECLIEFNRILKPGGFLIFKCQDTVSSGKQWLSHVHIINEAEKLGLYTKDFFILNAKNRIKGHNHQIQKHARKFHSYFIVFEKPKSKNKKVNNENTDKNS